ncbi:hypothetical protein BOTBODRAFT_376870 [Botryobasidium botryosum FD-172 SS1]|uniref:Uncharacterized protein n=1 Tax=Botryobasidium botryosum (strain FD-172 SS1) TaxID=930990 RepID=A0A067N7N0_BOTB1|nr:hypothetical protein BOTBODRAFT_376870 [Botryobasidium botryosum FD-172 SS1]
MVSRPGTFPAIFLFSGLPRKRRCSPFGLGPCSPRQRCRSLWSRSSVDCLGEGAFSLVYSGQQLPDGCTLSFPTLMVLWLGAPGKVRKSSARSFLLPFGGVSSSALSPERASHRCWFLFSDQPSCSKPFARTFGRCSGDSARLLKPRKKLPSASIADCRIGCAKGPGTETSLARNPV